MDIQSLRSEIKEYTEGALLPFWIQRTVDKNQGGYITHFNEFGEDSGLDEKSLIAMTRSVFTYSQAYRHGFGGEVMKEMAAHGVQFLLDKMWAYPRSKTVSGWSVLWITIWDTSI